MKRAVIAAMLWCTMFLSLPAATEEPTVYVIKSGDTLWGLSERFLNDPYYWPHFWARNPEITNPHIIKPGQKVYVYPDRIELVPPGAAPQLAAPTESAPVVAPPAETAVAHGEEPAPQEPSAEATTSVEPKTIAPAPQPARKVYSEQPRTLTYTVNGSEGFILEKKHRPAGYIIATDHNRAIVGEDDIVYTDIGSERGGKAGARFDIFQRMEPISHPNSNVIVGYKVMPLGTLQLTEMMDESSRAIILKSFREIGPGAYLIPAKERQRQITLQPTDRDLIGTIVDSKNGSEGIGEGDIAYLDLGREQGVQIGNLLYVVRDVKIDQRNLEGPAPELPVDLIGALVVVARGDNTCTALVVKSIDTIYRGDRVEMRLRK
jgi:hypothetical protein